MRCLELCGDGVFIHVNVILVNGRHDELIAFGFHPCGDKRCQVQPWVPIQHEFIIDNLICCLLGNRSIWDLESANTNGKTEKSRNQEIKQRNHLKCLSKGLQHLYMWIHPYTMDEPWTTIPNDWTIQPTFIFIFLTYLSEVGSC